VAGITPIRYYSNGAFRVGHAWFYPDLVDADRFVLIGLSHRRRLVFTIHGELEGDRIRIIRARLATKRERRRYEEDD
jgi:uncharacterized DUF497 family protein